MHNPLVKAHLKRQLEGLPGVLRGLRLRARCKSLRSAVQQIEERTGVQLDPSQLSRWERGESTPTVESLLTLLTGLGSSFGDLDRELDRVARTELLPVLHELGGLAPDAHVIPVSARSGENIDRLEELLDAQLPESPFVYPADQLSDRSQRFLVAEIVREQLTRQLEQELREAERCPTGEIPRHNR